MRFLLATLFLSCLIAFAYADVQVMQKTSDTECTPIAVNECIGCLSNTTMVYNRCVVDDDDFDTYITCKEYSDSACTQYIHGGQIGPYPCDDDLLQCHFTYTLTNIAQITVSSSSNVTVVAKGHVIVNFYNGKVIVSGQLEGVAFATDSSAFSIEAVFDDGSFLTSTGTCDSGASCTAGDMTYTAEPITALPATSFDLKLNYHSRLGMESLSTATISFYESFLGVNSDEIDDLILLYKMQDKMLQIANMQLENLDTNHPILYYQTYVNGEEGVYEYVSCYWSSRYSEDSDADPYSTPGNPVTLECNFRHAFSQIEHYGSFSSLFLLENNQPNFLQRLVNFFH